MKSIGKVVLLTGALLYGVEADASVEPPVIFVEAYGSPGTEVARCVTPTQDGGFVVTGYVGGDTSGNIFLAKFDAEGTRLWRDDYKGGGNGEGRCVIETDDGYLVMVGYTSYDTAGQADFLLAKFDADGEKVWMGRWGGSRDDKAYGVIETQDGTLWAVGTTNSFTSWPYRTEVVLVKISPGGTSVTGARAGNPGLSRDFSGLALAEVFDTDGICVTGSVSRPAVGQDILLAKFNHTPELRWARRFGTFELAQNEVATSIVRTSDAGLALAGWASGPSGPMFARRGFLLKLDTDADYDWARRVSETSYGNPPPLGLRKVIETTDNGLVVVGGYPGSSSNAEVVLAKWLLDGTALWHKGFGDATGNVGYSIAEDGDQSLLIGGATTGYAYGQTDLLLARCCVSGAICIDGLDGPDFYGWAPDQGNIWPTSAEFTAATIDWYYPVSGVYWYRTQVCATTIHTVCPDDPNTIQDAIDAAANGDIIELCDATFTGTANRDLDFGGKCLTVRSQSGNPNACIIDCERAGRGFYFHSGEESHAVVEGITIANGSAVAGGGVYCFNSSPVIRDCRIVSCDSDDTGGGFWSTGGSPTLINCEFRGCSAAAEGGAMHCDGSGPTLVACTITGNSALLGGGIYSQGSDWEITDCTFAGNYADDRGGALVLLGSTATLENVILWGDCAPLGDEVYHDYPSSNDISFRCCDVTRAKVEGPGDPVWLEDNIDADPLFCDPRDCEDAPTSAGNYHLLADSPCVNPDCGLIGALCYAGDLDDDMDVDQGDLGALLTAWCSHPGDPNWDQRADLDCDGHVGHSDLGILLSNWGKVCP